MNPRLPPLRTGILLAGLTLVAGCGTPKEIRDLARASQTNAVLVSIQLDKFAARRNRIAQLRADSLAGWAREISKSEAKLAKKRAARTRAGDRETFNTVDNLKAYAAAVATEDRKPEEEAVRVRKEALAGSEKLKPPIDQIKALSRKLGSLADKESIKARLKFFFAFAKEVNAEMAKARKDQKKAEEKAAKLKIP